ncbi:hypothetical protein [Candidatus Viadribacter manganicus]|uniref:Uncharacterized protein n=1 Tax=Candidatus Viadribacter manganicus TaxID=1759059 RepID=A0A1B1AKS1_9PROT|nr:hypothetical protein [Candidatus Viadribacter manganicus]ANP47169.1 hypothetical protein ATE48_15225 [Candidatus Viadribacter manganicus]
MISHHRTNTLPEGGGEMGERIRAFDWSRHPLGAPETWPDALLRLCLNSTFPTRDLLGPRSPSLLQRRVGAHSC